MREQVVGLEDHADPRPDLPRVDARVGDLTARRSEIDAVVDVLEQVRRSAAASTSPSPRSRSGRPPRASRRSRSTSSRTTLSPYDLRTPGAVEERSQAPAALGADRGAVSQSVSRASGTVSAMKKHRGHDVRREVEVVVARSRGRRRPPRRPRPTATSAVSFCSETKSLSSGGTTRRTACGTHDVAQRLAAGQAERLRAGPCERVDRVDAGAEDLGDVGAVGHDQRDRRPDRTGCRAAPAARRAGMPKREQDDQQDRRDAADDVGVDAPRAPAPARARATGSPARARPTARRRG